MVLVFAGAAMTSEKPAYQLYDRNGEKITYDHLVNLAQNKDLVFFGELHDNAIAHWLQLELLKDLHADTTRSLAIGMEMFERDQQILIDEYFAGHISNRSFESEARLWQNYETDYAPVVEFARENDLRLLATNIPRRYASAVYSHGLAVLDSLNAEAKDWIAPLPVEVDTTLPGYRDILEAAQGHGGENLIYSQAVKDATMAHSIISAINDSTGMLHLNGSYHSNNYEGIVWYVNRKAEGVTILTINTISADEINNVDAGLLQAADITLVVDSDMTRTY
ncbi:iron-regulated protein [Rhodohalobacter mucosus]|uniref:Iron-regulated protein n=2 Tax=Rhodohalobacter mucosus TaxID=2079485 RepID=A0A316TS00_9BACT|nr:iron-regulated protein [Rhodohalobacter mucosus]